MHPSSTLPRNMAMLSLPDCSIELNINRLEKHDINVCKTKGIRKKKIRTPMAMADPQNSIARPVKRLNLKKINRPANIDATVGTVQTVFKDACVPEILRNKVQQAVKEALLRSSEMQLKQFVNCIAMISGDVEGLIFEQFPSTYREKCRDILYNLKDPNNGALRDAVCKGIIH